MLFHEGAFGVQPLQDDELAEVSREFLGIVFRILETEVGCGFPWFDLGEGGQAESEEGGASKEEAFDHDLLFHLGHESQDGVAVRRLNSQQRYGWKKGSKPCLVSRRRGQF